MAIGLILGTAGHIDHGKTSLIRALTGIDTDRLPEEKKRGITIELGFAELVAGRFRLGIVDVPGHERFVRNMLAGATGMDLGMLVVAADDSVKPQTREHLEIMRLLDLPAGVIALTKCDLVEGEWLELVEEEIRDLVRGSFLEDAPIIRTSTVSGAGLDELRRALESAAERVASSDRMNKRDGPFRMAIDRVFTVSGHGTVVTGSVSSGQTALGDELLIEPGGIHVRVRGLQNHDRTVEQIWRGQRAAINLAGVRHGEIVRGQELASPGHLSPSRLVSVWLRLLATAPRPLKSRNRVRLHVGTNELMTSVKLLGTDRLEPGQSGLAQLFLSEPAVATWNQPFVIRSESPVATIGGGQILDPCAQRIRKADAQVLAQLDALRASDPQRRASAALYFAGIRGFKPSDLARTAGISNYDQACQALRDSGELREIAVSPTRAIRLHRLVLEQLGERIEAALAHLHQRFPLQTVVERSRLASGFAYLGDDTLLDVILRELRAAKRVRLTDRGIALQGHGPKLSQNEQKLLTQIVETYRQAGLQVPTVKQVQEQAAKSQESVPQLVALAAANGELVAITPEIYLHADVVRQLQQTLAEKLVGSNGLTMSQIREILNTTRKYAVPLCEYLDQSGFTRREGDLRFLADASAAS